MKYLPTGLAAPLIRILSGRPAGVASPGRRSAGPGSVHARYDAAQTTNHNVNHWSFSDGRSADASANPSVRRILRDRTRYEVANNCFGRFAVTQIALDTILTGPRLQMQTPSKQVNERIERAWKEWTTLIGLTDKLAMMREARAESGECFLGFISNPALQYPVRLDIRLIEADQVADPFGMDPADSLAVDGIRFDEAGNPTEYHVLRVHPGDDRGLQNANQIDRVGAEDIIHYFRPTRPGQSRGIPDLTPALALFAQMRRFTLATLQAAENAANLAFVIQTDAPSLENVDEVEAMDVIELHPGMATTLPAGWKIGGVDIDQPQSTIEMFQRLLLVECSRCLDMPINILMGDSSRSNFSSARMDHLVYDSSLQRERGRIDRIVLDRIFSKWLQEAVLVDGFIPISMRNLVARVSLPDHLWIWPNREPVDAAKAATAAKTELETGTTTLAREIGKKGLDWREVMHQQAAERDLKEELQLTTEPQEGASNGETDPENEPANSGRGA